MDPCLLGVCRAARVVTLRDAVAIGQQDPMGIEH